MTKLKLYTFLLLLTAVTAFGQQKQVEASIDSTKIRIGSQFHLTLKTTVDTTAKVNFPEGKNFGQLEVLETMPTDTVRKGAQYQLVKKYGLTQFDSGRYVIPPLPVVINNKTIQTDSLHIEVANIVVDTLKQKMYDIKPVMTVKEPRSYLWLYILIGIVVLAAAGFGVWWFLKKRKRKPKDVQVHYASPIEKATTQLKVLENKDLLQKGAVKDYYSELTDIARQYIEEAIHVPAMESTTAELIEAMRIAVRRKKMNLSQETFEELEKVLRTADMVKFAKSRPMDFEIAEDRSRIEKSIVVIDRSIPEEKEEDEEHTLKWLEQQRLKKQKRKRTIIIASVAAAVLAILIAVSVTVGLGYLRDNLIGYPTKTLLEGEWVKSQYGNPPVTIETPKVLERMNTDEYLPKDAAAMLKDAQIFSYGKLLDDFNIVLSTVSYKQQVQIDNDKTVENLTKLWESQGAKNIVTKQEDYTTENGIKGRHVYGTMKLPNPVTGKDRTAAYEWFIFSQNGGLQQVGIVHQTDDEYAEQITEKIKNSIEFAKINKVN